MDPPTPPPPSPGSSTHDYVLWVVVTILSLLVPMFAKKVYKLITQCMHRTKTTNDVYRVAKEGSRDAVDSKLRMLSLEKQVNMLTNMMRDQLIKSDAVSAAIDLVKKPEGDSPSDVKRKLSRERLMDFIISEYEHYNRDTRKRVSTVA